LIELQLWEYIDGQCNPADNERIAGLIATDRLWSEHYSELLALHNGIAAFAETEEPSMRFTKNVMEAVAATGMARPTRMYINRNIIRLVAACFGLLFVVVIGMVVIYAPESGSKVFTFHQAMPEIKTMIPSINTYKYMSYLVWLCVPLGWILLDSLLKKKKLRISN